MIQRQTQVLELMIYCPNFKFDWCQDATQKAGTLKVFYCSNFTFTIQRIRRLPKLPTHKISFVVIKQKPCNFCRPLYKLARQGIEIERKARSVTIHKLDFLGYENGIISLEVSCSKGTYIRSLIADIGEKLGCGAHVIELRRTGFAHIDITQAIKFADLETLIGDTDADFEQLDAKIFPSEAMLPSIHSVTIDKQQSIDIRYGRKIKIENQADNLVKMFDENTIFLGIGQIENGYLQPKRLFI
jgi:tRNA pseudouridine55 synthase